MKSIKPSEIRGRVEAPPSKSMTGRAIAAALLAGGTTELVSSSFCDDSLAALDVVQALGAGIACYSGGSVSSPALLSGKGISGKLIIEGNPSLVGHGKGTILDCGESGLTMRMFTPIAGLMAHETILTGSGSLMTRPMKMVEQMNKAVAYCKTSNGLPPISVRGPIRGGIIGVDASVTSQFLTGLLMALPVCGANSRLIVSNLKSKPYVLMTLSLLEAFGIEIDHDESYDEFSIRGDQTYKPCIHRIEGDWSGAAFLLVAGALAGSVTIGGLNQGSFQADRAILKGLRLAGSEINMGGNNIKVIKKELKGFVFDAADCPDLVPPLVALAANCTGVTTIYGTQRLRHKESDRAAVLVSEFGKLGIPITLEDDTMKIRGGTLRGGTINPHNDHRIAMACAVAALNGQEPVIIEDSHCVSKSYPDFFNVLKRLRATP